MTVTTELTEAIEKVSGVYGWRSPERQLDPGKGWGTELRHETDRYPRVFMMLRRLGNFPSPGRLNARVEEFFLHRKVATLF